MKLELKRRFKGPDYTIGDLYINGKFFSNTLEDTDRNLTQYTPIGIIQKIKVSGETAIPTGRYKIIINKSPKFKRDLPRLQNVPGFTGILIHRGNTNRDTSGCILVGENKIVGKVINSTEYEVKLVKTLTEAQSRNEDIEITIS